MNKRLLAAAGAAVLVTGLVGASAATLGGITGSSVGADEAVVAACDTNGIAVGYATAYSTSASAYQVTGVNLSGVDAACNGLNYALTLADSNGTSLAQATGKLAVTAGAATITVTPVTASSVSKLAVIVSG